MTTHDGVVERAIRMVMVALARATAVVLIAGLGWWLIQPDSPASLRLLDAGIRLLMAVPLLRVLQSAARAIRLRDWLHVATIVAVAALLATALWYASRVA